MINFSKKLLSIIFFLQPIIYASNDKLGGNKLVGFNFDVSYVYGQPYDSDVDLESGEETVKKTDVSTSRAYYHKSIHAGYLVEREQQKATKKKRKFNVSQKHEIKKVKLQTKAKEEEPNQYDVDLKPHQSYDIQDEARHSLFQSIMNDE